MEKELAAAGTAGFATLQPAQDRLISGTAGMTRLIRSLSGHLDTSQEEFGNGKGIEYRPT
jgi:hypothetical protein